MISATEAAAKAKWATAHPQRWLDELRLEEEEELHRHYEEGKRHAIELVKQAYNKAYVDYLVTKHEERTWDKPVCLFVLQFSDLGYLDRVEEFLEENLPFEQRAEVVQEMCEMCNFHRVTIYIREH